MTINFYLNNQEETQITSLYEMVSTPFNVGDEISLDVNELYPIQVDKFKPDSKKNFIERNDELRNLFRLKHIKIVRVYNSMRFNLLSKTTVTIDYYCEFVNS